MKKNILLLSTCLSLLLIPLFAADGPGFQITVFENRKSTGWSYGNKGGAATGNVSIFRIQFKITAKEINSLDVAKIYFFNKDKELVDTLTQYGTSLLGQNNTISNLKDLDNNKLYSLEFIYDQKDMTKWKYAIALLGTKEKFVSRCIPSNEKPESFEFTEKSMLVK